MAIEGFSGASNVTRWHNPTPYTRKVRICMEGAWRTVKWAPDETVELPSIYDRAVQIVICQEDSCNGRGPASIKCQPCTKGHHGQIMGGQDPLLVRLDRGDTKNPSLDPDEVVRMAQEEEAKQIASHQKAITAALIMANQAAAPAPAKPTARSNKDAT